MSNVRCSKCRYSWRMSLSVERLKNCPYCGGKGTVSGLLESMPVRKIPNRWTKGKSYHRYFYTVKDLAECTGLSAKTVRNFFTKNRLSFRNLTDVFKFLRQYLS